MQQKTGLSDLRNVVHREEETEPEHAIRFHPCKSICLDQCKCYLTPLTAYIKIRLFQFYFCHLKMM